AAAADHHPRDERGMEREDSFHPFVVHNPADRERLVDAAAFAHDDGPGKDLDALFFALDDPGVHVNRVTYVELRGLGFKVILFDGFDESVDHDSLRSAPGALRPLGPGRLGRLLYVTFRGSGISARGRDGVAESAACAVR